MNKARTLLEHHASPNTFARIARFGRARLDVPTQAIKVMPGPVADRDAVTIEALALLKEYGLSIEPKQREKLASRASQRPAVHGRIEANL